MSRLKELQLELKQLGYYSGGIDGVYGPKSHNAFLKLVEASKHNNNKMAWGKKVSSAFKTRITQIADSLDMPKEGVDWLMACMAWESGETFSPSIQNMAGSGAIGLIQWIPSTARSLGTTTEELTKMTAEQQLDYVEKYFLPYKGKLNTLSDVYMAILWPRGIGKQDDYVLWDRDTRPTTYRQNAGLDNNKDGFITKAEAAAKVFGKLAKGKQEQYYG